MGMSSAKKRWAMSHNSKTVDEFIEQVNGDTHAHSPTQVEVTKVDMKR